MATKQAYVQVKGLKKHYGDGDARLTVLDGIDASINRGEICVMLGPSGSGKSTFLNLIGGLEDADAGSILVDGCDLTVLKAGDLTLNRSTYELCWQGNAQPLSGREFQVMELLMERPGCVVSPGQLLSHVWGWDSPVEVSVVWVHVSNLRKKLEKLGAAASIRFLRGAGYVLEVGA